MSTSRFYFNELLRGKISFYNPDSNQSRSYRYIMVISEGTTLVVKTMQCNNGVSTPLYDLELASRNS